MRPGYRMDRVTVSLMGLTGPGGRLLEILKRHRRVRLVAIADRNVDVLAKAGDGSECEQFDDYRQLVVQRPCDLLIIAAPPFASTDQAVLAAQRGAHVWRLPPLARSFERAVAMEDAFRRAGRMLWVASGWRASRPYEALRERLDKLGRIYLIRASCMRWLSSDELGWRGDSVRAGGGVLLNWGYDPIERIIQLLGPPNGVVANCSRWAGISRVKSYDTEDAATVMLRYPENAVGVVTTSWMNQPEEERFTLHGSCGSARIDDKGLTLWDDRGQPAQPVPHEASDGLAAQLEAVLAAVAGERPAALPTPELQLQTMACIEVAYLSARTGQPESPASLLNLHGITSAGPPTSSPESPTEPMFDESVE